MPVLYVKPVITNGNQLDELVSKAEAQRMELGKTINAIKTWKPELTFEPVYDLPVSPQEGTKGREKP
jgi:hypothetical protein